MKEELEERTLDYSAVFMITSALEFAIILFIYAAYAPEHIPNSLELPMIIFIGKALLFGMLGMFFFGKHLLLSNRTNKNYQL